VIAARSSTAPPSPSSPSGRDPGPDRNGARCERRHEVDLRQPAKLRDPNKRRPPRPRVSAPPRSSGSCSRGEGVRVGTTSDALHRRRGSGEGSEAGAQRADPEANGGVAVDGIAPSRSRSGSTRTGNWPRPSSASQPGQRGMEVSSSPEQVLQGERGCSSASGRAGRSSFPRRRR